MSFDFSEKVAVVTGGASGIGEEIALEFARNGASVVVADVQDDAGESVVEQIEETDGEAVYAHTDVTDTNSVEAMVDTALEEFGGLDFGVNNAGIGGDQKLTGDYTEENWQHVLDVNLTGVWRSTRAELEPMVEQGSGSIINMASILGQVGFETASAYVSAKHGVVGLTKTTALEYAQQGVRVNAIGPGFIETPLLEAGGITEDQEMRGQIENLHAMNRLGQPDEVASAVMWLCSDGASFVTGEYLAIDGGYLAR